MANGSQNDDDDGDNLGKFLGDLTKGFNKLKPTPHDDFFRAVRNNRTDLVRKLLKGGLDPNTYNSRGQTALHVAVVSNAPDVARLMIEQGANPLLGRQDAPEHTPLTDAISLDKPKIATLLAENGGYVPGAMVDGWSPLHHACEKGQLPTVEALLEAGADINERTENGATPLLIAVNCYQEELAKRLLKIPAVVETMNECFVQTDKKERTAFQTAVHLEQESLVEFMISQGGAVNSRDADGKSPLLSAIESANPDLTRLLVVSGADLNKPCGPKGTPLVYACIAPEIRTESVRTRMIEMLVRLGADTDTPDSTPLIEAVKHNRLPSVEALLKAGADPKLFDALGKTALSYARESGRTEIIRVLERALKDNPPGKPFSSPGV